MPYANKETNAACKARWAKAHAKDIGRILYNKAWKQSPRGKFSTHKTHATERGIAFLLTFDEWWELWYRHWEDKDGLVMARYGDTGPYAVGNVRIDTVSANISEAWENNAYASR